MKITTKLWLGILLLALISPLGLLLPVYFKAGPAFGESKLLFFWKAPMPDYSFGAKEGAGLWHLSLSYIISAVAGIIITVIIVLLIGRKLTKKGS